MTRQEWIEAMKQDRWADFCRLSDEFDRQIATNPVLRKTVNRIRVSNGLDELPGA